MERGLYLLRYVGSSAGREAPVAFARPAQGSEEHVQIITAPGRPEGELSFPGTNLVVVARRAGLIELSVQPCQAGGSLDAQLNIDLIATAGEGREPVRQMPGRSPWDARPSAPPPVSGPVELEFIAHVSRRGDVVVGPGEWAAGPSQPAPIEGIEIRAGDQGVAIEGQFTNTRDGRWSPWLRAGVFIGTRQQASPMTGLRLRLVGDGTDDRVLQAEALFLGSPVVVQSDRTIELVSPAGVDPLVGLRLSVKPRSSPGEIAVVAKPRVRVFRAAKPTFSE